jgi:hypothetical protein
MNAKLKQITYAICLSAALAATAHSAMRGPAQDKTQREAFDMMFNLPNVPGAPNAVVPSLADVARIFVESQDALIALTSCIRGPRVQCWTATCNQDGSLDTIASPCNSYRGLQAAALRDDPNPIRAILEETILRMKYGAEVRKEEDEDEDDSAEMGRLRVQEGIAVALGMVGKLGPTPTVVWQPHPHIRLVALLDDEESKVITYVEKQQMGLTYAVQQAMAGTVPLELQDDRIEDTIRSIGGDPRLQGRRIDVRTLSRYCMRNANQNRDVPLLAVEVCQAARIFPGQINWNLPQQLRIIDRTAD